MIVDTNILLRLIDGPAAGQQHALAAEWVRTAQAANVQLLVTDATFLEVGFVLRSAGTGYGWEVGEVARVLADLLETLPFTFERLEALRTAVTIYEATGFDLHDCYLEGRARTAKPEDKVLSLDGDFEKM